MDINKRTILWIVFSVSILFLWDAWMVSNGKQSMFSFAPQPAATAPAAKGGNASLPSAAASATGAAVLPGTTPAATAAAAVRSERVTITTDIIKAEIDTAGGVLRHLELLNFKDEVDPTKNKVLFDISDKRTFEAQTGLISTNGVALPNHTTAFSAKPGARNIDGGNEVQLVLEAEENGVKLTKTFTFKRGEYVIGVRHDITNTGTTPVTPSLYLQLIHDGTKPASDSYFNSSYTGPTLYTDAEHYQKLDFEKIEKNKAEHATKADNGWIAISQHFFVSAFVPPEKAQRDIFTKKVDTNLYAIGTVMPLGTVAPGATISSESKLYAGPQDSKLLEKVAPGLDLVKDYGMLKILAEPMFWVMGQIHHVLGNWGWTIIAFTILIKLLFFPLSAASYRSMAKIKQVTPKMQAIRERFKDDPAKMNQATMELYKTEKINPLGGCLPVLVQMPVFIALYWVLQASVEMRGAPWVGWIHDLTRPDPFYILPVLYAISMFITQKMSPAPADPVQAKMMMFMPLAFSIMFFFFPSGLVLYWVVNNILSIAQQYVISKQFDTTAK
jgi:YidC/Oxa1 family membrane protein insertase